MSDDSNSSADVADEEKKTSKKKQIDDSDSEEESKPARKRGKKGSDSDAEKEKPKKKTEKKKGRKEASSESEEEEEDVDARYKKSKQYAGKTVAIRGPPPRRNQPNDDGEHRIDLGKNRSIIVRSFKGKTLIDIREFYMDRDTGEFKPGKKGIALSEEQWKKLTECIDEVNEAVAKI